MQDQQKPYWLATLYFKNFSDRKLQAALSHFDHIEALFKASEKTWCDIGLSDEAIYALKNPDWRSVERDLAWEQYPNHHILVWGDADYPLLLAEIADPPRVIFIKGNRHALVQKQIAMVGSRHATKMGLDHAEQFSYVLAEAGLVMTSGLALGIDGACHRGALNAKGLTVGVAGTGLNLTYPSQHKKLVDEMIDHHGAVISEFPLSAEPAAWRFPRRNRIIAGLSLGVVVVEAALKSGSLITARLAIESGREVFAIPGSIHNPLARGCHHLIRQGAKLVETADDIIEELGAISITPRIAELPKITDTRPPVPNEHGFLLDYVETELTPLDVIISRSQLTAGEVSSILLVLELNGYVQSLPGGYIKLN